MRKKFLLLLVLAIVVFGISACAGRNTEQESQADPLPTQKPELSETIEVTDASEPVYNDYTEDTDISEPASVDNAESTDATEAPNDGTSENTDKSEPPLLGFYSNLNYLEPCEDASIELFEDGSAILNTAGRVWNATWDENNIYNSETGKAYRYTFHDWHLSFSWETEHGLCNYTVFYSSDEKLQCNFFDRDYSRSPQFIFHKDGTNYGFTYDFWEGCSVWCAVMDYHVSAKASSTLKPQGQFSYTASNIYSSDRRNAWIEGAEGYGIGEYIDITRYYTVSDYGVDFQELCVVNGYAQTTEKWAANSRVKDLKFYFNGKYIDTLHLEDSIRPQYFDLTKYKLYAASGAESVFRFEIASVYPGEKYADTAITGIEVSFWTPNH